MYPNVLLIVMFVYIDLNKDKDISTVECQKGLLAYIIH